MSEADGSSPIVLNEFVSNELSASIREMPSKESSFTLTALKEDHDFTVRVFKLYAPRNQRSRLSLVAHRRDVSGSVLSKYIPEFDEEF